MSTGADRVKYGRDADFAGQTASGKVGRFFPDHNRAIFDRLPVLAQHHGQSRLPDDFIHRSADHRFAAQSGDPQKRGVDGDEAESTFRFDCEVENDISNGVID